MASKKNTYKVKSFKAEWCNQELGGIKVRLVDKWLIGDPNVQEHTRCPVC